MLAAMNDYYPGNASMRRRRVGKALGSFALSLAIIAAALLIIRCLIWVGIDMLTHVLAHSWTTSGSISS